MPDLSDIITAIASQGEGNARRKFVEKAVRKELSLTADQVDILTEDMKSHAMDYMRCKTECPFKPGDIVTPKDGTQLRYRGLPWVVLEVYDNPIYVETENHSSSEYGQRLDIRTAVRLSDNLVEFANSSWQFELWDREKYLDHGYNNTDAEDVQ